MPASRHVWFSLTASLVLLAAGCGSSAGTGSTDGGGGVDAAIAADAASADAAGGDDAAAGDDAASADAAATADASASADAASLDGASADAAPADAMLMADAAPDATVSTDPFDPGSCNAPALTAAEALAMLGAAPRSKLGDATLMRRTRSCTGATPDTCGAWGTPVPHTQALLTYSGGVVTDYKTFSFPTHLVLYTQTGQPRLSVRHSSDYQHDATASSRGVVFSFGADPMENSYPIIYVWDFNPAPNRYEDLQGLLGNRGQLHAAQHCARVVFTSGVTTEIAALYTY